MEQRVVNKNFMDNLKVHSINKNSILFVSGNDLIKMPIIHNEYTNSNLERIHISNIEGILNYLEELNEDYYVLPKYSLYTFNVKTSNYKGYGMDYLVDYIKLSKIIEQNNYTHGEKIELCKKICDMIMSLEKYKIAYWDIHSNNVLIKDKDIKLCDMDSSTSSRISGSLDYKVDLMWSYKHLTSLLLSIIYGIDELSFINIIKDNKDSKIVKDSKMFKRVIDKNNYMFYPDKYLDSFTEDYVESTKLILKR